MTGISVITQYWQNPQHIGFSALQDLENAFKLVGILPITYKFEHNIGGLKRYFKSPIIFQESYEHQRNNTLLICCYTPSFIATLKKNTRILSDFQKVSVYFLDGFDSKTLDNYDRSLLDGIDYCFSLCNETAEELKSIHKVKSHFIPLGAPCFISKSFTRRPIDIIGYGRSDPKLHNLLSETSLSNSIPFYFHETVASAYIEDIDAFREMRMAHLARSTFSLCCSAGNLKRFHGKSPILYRWLEAYCCGCIPLGSPPKGKKESDILNWDGAFLELGNDNEENLTTIIEHLKSPERISKMSDNNRLKALSELDWRIRIQEILDILNIDYTEELSLYLKKLTENHSK